MDDTHGEHTWVSFVLLFLYFFLWAKFDRSIFFDSFNLCKSLKTISHVIFNSFFLLIIYKKSETKKFPESWDIFRHIEGKSTEHRARQIIEAELKNTKINIFYAGDIVIPEKTLLYIPNGEGKNFLFQHYQLVIQSVILFSQYFCLKQLKYYNDRHNILRLFDTIPNFRFTTSKT